MESTAPLASAPSRLTSVMASPTLIVSIAFRPAGVAIIVPAGKHPGWHGGGGGEVALPVVPLFGEQAETETAYATTTASVQRILSRLRPRKIGRGPRRSYC